MPLARVGDAVDAVFLSTRFLVRTGEQHKGLGFGEDVGRVGNGLGSGGRIQAGFRVENGLCSGDGYRLGSGVGYGPGFRVSGQRLSSSKMRIDLVEADDFYVYSQVSESELILHDPLQEYEQYVFSIKVRT